MIGLYRFFWRDTKKKEQQTKKKGEEKKSIKAVLERKRIEFVFMLSIKNIFFYLCVFQLCRIHIVDRVLD